MGIRSGLAVKQAPDDSHVLDSFLYASPFILPSLYRRAELQLSVLNRSSN